MGEEFTRTQFKVGDLVGWTEFHLPNIQPHEEGVGLVVALDEEDDPIVTFTGGPYDRLAYNSYMLELVSPGGEV